MKQKLCLGDCYALTNHKRKQYTIRYISLLAVLTSMCLYAVKQVSAQTAKPAATAVADIKPLQIGDTVPEYVWQLPLQVVNHPEGKKTITLNDYRGKLIILDFWGTFCSSCIAAMPRINEVQEQLLDKMVVLPVSWSDPIATEKALLNHKTLRRLNLASIVEAKPLINLFPHRVVPHYAWIDPAGVLVATSSANDVSVKNVAELLQNKQPGFELKTFADIEKPLFFAIDDLPKEADLQRYSVFIRGRIPGLGSSARLRKKGSTVYGMTIFNRRLLHMYSILAAKTGGKPPGKRLILVDPITDNTPCTFDFIAGSHQVDSLYFQMLDELNQTSGYVGEWTTRRRPCLLLTTSGTQSTFVGRGSEKIHMVDDSTVRIAQYPLKKLLARLNQHDISKDKIIINETGYEGMVDITLRAPFDDLANIRKQLNLHGLDLLEEEREVEVFEIREKPGLKYTSTDH